jgi:ankyrin repeat protein
MTAVQKKLGLGAIVSLAIAITACAWMFSRRPSVAETMRRTPPAAFFSDPLQVSLAAAVDRGDAAGVAAAVQRGADVNARGRGGYSLLYWAMARDRVAGFEALVQHGADVTRYCRDPDEVSDPRLNDRPIRLSLSAKNPGFLEALLRQGFDPEFVVSRSGGDTLLFAAIRDHSECASELLLNAGADIDRRDSSGHTPIGVAGLISDYKLVWLLLQRGADPMVGSADGKDLPKMLKTYGSRGIRPGQQEYFEKVVAELERRGLLTRQDIVEADKPKPSVLGSRSGVTVIQHSPDSEGGRALRELDEAERASTRRSGD